MDEVVAVDAPDEPVAERDELHPATPQTFIAASA